VLGDGTCAAVGATNLHTSTRGETGLVLVHVNVVRQLVWRRLKKDGKDHLTVHESVILWYVYADEVRLAFKGVSVEMRGGSRRVAQVGFSFLRLVRSQKASTNNVDARVRVSYAKYQQQSQIQREAE
jgi:hypothetical protein